MKISNGLICIISVIMVTICLGYWSSCVQVSKLTQEQRHRRHLEHVAETAILINRVKDGQGTINDQRWDIEKISFRLQNILVTSEELGQSGQWVAELRRLVDNREAIEALTKLRVLEKKAQTLTRAEISTAENLFKVITKRIDSSENYFTGPKINHGELWRIMYHIRHKGANPP